MNQFVHDFIAFIDSNKDINTKEELIQLACQLFGMTKDGRALYRTDLFAVVFCYSKGNGFPNVVLSLSKLEKYDHIPCFAVLVRRNADNCIYMINTTFLNKISHSSKDLSTHNIKGSFLGSNIRKTLDEIGKENKPDAFDDLFAYHQGFTWKENLERLVESTNDIKPTKVKATFTTEELDNLFDSPHRAARFVRSSDFNVLQEDLQHRCKEALEAIMTASRIDNINIRGRLIEVLITADKDTRRQLLQDLSRTEHLLPAYDTKNSLADYERSFVNADTYTDIKTKILCLHSNPKAYNIDKFLKCMAQEKSVFLFFFVGIDEAGSIKTTLCSVFHDQLQENTILQHHWAGRGTRGTAQFNGKKINELLQDSSFANNIDEDKSKEYLHRLLER